MKSLIIWALTLFAWRFAAVSLCLFIPAGTLDFWEAWLFLPVFFVPDLSIIIYLLGNDPDLLKRRLKGGEFVEKRITQKAIMVLMKLCFTVLLLVPAWDHHFGWSHVPAVLVVAADAGVLLGLWIHFRVFKENTFASAVVTIVPEQKVISTGPYAVVRHPMYAGVLVVDSCIPIALGSWWGLPVVLGMLGVIILRLLDEEKLLRQSLPGYEDYCRKVPYRLIPHIW
jgi:protein-S-isoprenylcysteine O-methyltransferase Ste14